MGGDSASWEEFRKKQKAEKKAKGDTCGVLAIAALGLSVAAGVVASAAGGGWI